MNLVDCIDECWDKASVVLCFIKLLLLFETTCFAYRRFSTAFDDAQASLKPLIPALNIQTSQGDERWCKFSLMLSFACSISGDWKFNEQLTLLTQCLIFLQLIEFATFTYINKTAAAVVATENYRYNACESIKCWSSAWKAKAFVAVQRVLVIESATEYQISCDRFLSLLLRAVHKLETCNLIEVLHVPNALVRFFEKTFLKLKLFINYSLWQVDRKI